MKKRTIAPRYRLGGWSVLDYTGLPVANARVLVTAGDKVIMDEVTDASGFIPGCRFRSRNGFVMRMFDQAGLMFREDVQIPASKISFSADF